MLASALPSAAIESGPQGIVRQFCQADALGRRVTLQGWADFAPLVDWRFEPAWDHVVLITGYAVGAPQPAEGGALAVEVRYDVVGDVSALGLETAVHIERVTFRVHAPEQAWHIIGPPVPPHISASRIEIGPMRQSFEQGGLNFLPNSLFVWQMFRSAGWDVPFQRTLDLLPGSAYRVVESPAVGDVVLYLRDGVPYHTGLLEAEHQVVSTTLNAGIVRTTADAFAGEVKYLRLIRPPALPARGKPTPPPPVRRPTPQPAKERPTNVSRRGTQPSPQRRVETAGKAVPTRAPVTPTARRTAP